MENNTRSLIKRTANGLGFLLFAVTCAMEFSAVFLFLLIRNLDSLTITVISIFVSIASMFLVGLFYCLFSKTDINDTIVFSRIGFGKLLMIVAMGTTVAIAADYITELLIYNMKIIGVQNNIDLDTHSSTMLENILNILGVAFIPPLTEEFLFRGIILGKLRKFGDGFAIILSSSLFAILHMNIVQIPFAFTVGLVLAFVTVKTNSLLPAILIHFANNFRSVLVGLLSDGNVIDENLLNILYILFIILIFVAGIISTIILSKDRNFFKIKSSEISLRDALVGSISSGGMITFYAVALLLTVTTIRFG